jgi:hypothetical protein
MKDKKIKIISTRISLEDYLELKNYFYFSNKNNPKKHKTFSDYIRYLLEVGLNEYY